MSFNTIPRMTDPLSIYWEQPAGIRQAPMDDTHVLLSTEQVKQLKDYSGSIPSGTYDGKCWKRKHGKGWCLCWYHPHEDLNRIGIDYRIILEIE